MRSSLIVGALCCAVATTTFAAGPWYVAKDDPNAADTLVEGRGTEALPFRTIQAAIDNPDRDAGDTVYVKPGIYDEGGAVDPTYGMSNRVYISTKSVVLKADGKKGEVHIVGRHDPLMEDSGQYGCGTNTVRCICVNAASGTVIEGFTLRDGATREAENGSIPNSSKGGGLFVYSYAKDVYLVDCVVSNCSARHGGGMCGGTAVRTLFDHCFGNTSGSGFDYAYAFSCVFTRCVGTYVHGYNSVPTISVNCSFVGNVGVLPSNANATAYNALIAWNSGTEKSTKATAANSTLTGTAAEGRFQVFSPVFDDYRLMPGATAIGLGLASWTNELVAAGVDPKYLTHDFLGAEIVPDGEGKVNAGAVQAVASTPAASRLVFDSAVYLNGRYANANAWICSESWPVQYMVRPVVPSGKTFYCYYHTKVSSDQEPLCIYPQYDGNMYVVPPPASAAASQTLQPKYAAAEIWVDPSNAGSDENGDGSEASPYKTLQKAVDESIDYTLIHAKRGEYASGGKVVSNLLSRVDFSAKSHVLLRAEEGPDVTAIVGAFDLSTLSDTGEPGCGADAVRCAMIGYHTAIQGFTLKGGRTLDRSAATDGTTSDWGKNGAAVYGLYSSSRPRGQILDCVVTNCVGVNSVLFACHAQRCRVVGNRSRDFLFNRGYYATTLVHGNVCRGYTVNGANSYMCTYAGNSKHPAQSEFIDWSKDSVPRYSVFVGGSVGKASDSDYGNYVWNQTSTANLSENSTVADPHLVDIASGDLRPFAFSPVIHEASAIGTFYKFVTSDFCCRPLAISRDGLVSAGACQSELPSAVVVSASGGGLLVNGEAASATNVVEEGETFNAVLSGDPESSRWCMGVSVDGEERLFDTWPGSIELSFEYSTSPVVVTALYSTNWYVDAVNGSDTNRGFTAATAKKTLAEVFTNCAVVAGDVVNALPGTYGEGAMKRAEADTVSARAVVPALVTLRSTAGAENTVVMGGELVRCLYLGGKARAEGLTLTGGKVRTATDAADMDRYGGGVRSAAWNSSQTDSLPTVTDCVISNNIASRAGGGAYARFVKCRFHDNWGMNDNMSAAGYGTFHHCIVDGNFGGSALMYPYEVYNCTLGPKNYKSDGKTRSYDLYFSGAAGAVKVFNSIVFRPNNDSGYYRNCALGSDTSGKISEANKGEGSILTNVAAIAIGDDYRPLPGSPVIDMGVSGLGSEGDEWFPEFDIGGVQRVMNGGRFDVGAMEHDWRPRYAKDMGGGVCVTDVSTGVVETAGLVVLADGETLGLDWARRRSTKFEFSVEVSGGGTLSVSRDGEAFAEVLAADGVKKLAFTSELAMNRLEFAFSGDGYAALSKFSRGAGVYIVVR